MFKKLPLAFFIATLLAINPAFAEPDSQVSYELKGSESFEHPLQKICGIYSYGGNIRTVDGNKDSVEHFINCTYKDGSIKLLSNDYLIDLGYGIYLKGRVPILEYKDKHIMLNQF